MNPVIRELQNIELARAFGPTATLGGELVRAEWNLARQERLGTDTGYPNASTASQVINDFNRLSPITTIGEAVQMIAASVVGFWLLWMVIVSMVAGALDLPQDLAFCLGGWTGLIILTAIFTSLAVSELQQQESA